MREIGGEDDLRAACAGDPLCLWAAQGLAPGRGRAWRSADGRAVAVAGHSVSARDRLAVRGDPESAVPLVREVLGAIGPAFRPFGDRAVVEALARELPGLEVAGRFGWMDRGAAGPVLAPGAAQWLPGEAAAEVAALLDEAFPGSYAKPGGPGVERWAGVRDATGRLAAVGALAWSAPSVGFLAGIAVRPAARGGGLARQVCSLLLTGALRTHGTAALMVDDWNAPALALYRSLGFTYRPIAAAARGPGR